MNFFAQIENVPGEMVKNIALVAMACLVGAYYVKSIFFDKPLPQPIETRRVEQLATKKELQDHVTANAREHENIFSKIGGVERGSLSATDKKIEDLRHERRDDFRTLHAEINDVGRKVAGLEKETELQNQNIARMDAKLDRLIERKQS